VTAAESLRQDVSLAFRMMRKSPGFTAAIVCTLALGCGAATAIFSVVNSVLLRPLPLHDPDRIVFIWENDRLRRTAREWTSLPDFLDMQRETKSYQHLAAYQRHNLTLSGNGEPERVVAARITPGYFQVLGVQPVIGHEFTESESKAGNAVLLSHSLWQRRFGSSTAIVGTALMLDGQQYTVTGVMPAGTVEALAPLHREEVWIPVTYLRNDMLRGRHDAQVLGRLKPGVSMQQANEEIAVVMSALEKAYADDNKGRSAYVNPAMDEITGQLRGPLYLLLIAVSILLLIACANVANLLIARAFAREQEMSIRISLGAGRGRLVRQLATENLVLAVAGGFGGWLLSQWGIRVLLALAPDTMPRMNDVQTDWRVFAFALGSVAFCWAVFGVFPAWRSANPAAVRAGRGASQRLRKTLISVEVALAVTLVVTCGLLGRSFSKLLDVDLGMRTAGIYTISIDLPASTYKPPQTWPIVEWPQVEALQDRILNEVRRLPGVESAAISTASLVRGAWTTRVTVDGRPIPAPGDQKEAELRIVTPEYFPTLGIPVKQGRPFHQTDDKGHTPVAIINEAFVKEHFPGVDAVGNRIRVFGRLYEIAGVAANARYDGPGSEMAPAMYIPFRQFPLSLMNIVVKAKGAPPLSQAIRAADPNLAGYDAASLDRVFAGTYALRRFTLVLAVCFATIALLLAAAGVYALISFTVGRQTREIGIRMALGAPRAAVFLSTVQSAIVRVAAGVVIGLVAAIAAARGIQSMLYQVSPWDPVTYLGVSALLLIVAVVAAWVPAIRASRIDPIIALRYE
jgi:putative ABC transport system permease protein